MGVGVRGLCLADGPDVATYRAVREAPLEFQVLFSKMLDHLFDHCERIDAQIRYRWAVNDVPFRDIRCAMHRAVWGYWPGERKGRRVTVKGDRPV